MRLANRSILLVLVCLFIGSTQAFQHELSVVVEPGKRECFHQLLVPELNMEVDYQVIQGGEMDVSFWVSSPSNRIIVTELRKNVGQHQFRTEEAGEYKFCFDNSFSRFAKKQVFFYIGTQDQYVDPLFQSKSIFDEIKAEKDELGDLDIKMDELKRSINHVISNLEVAQHLQTTFKRYEIADRNIMEHNYDRINFWSTVNMIVMVLVACLQVFMIRSLFEDKSKVGKVLRNFQ